MSKEEVYSRLKGVFVDIFDRVVPLSDATTAADVDGWDSFQNISLMGAIEDEFDTKFSIQEVVSFKCVGDIVSAILAR